MDVGIDAVIGEKDGCLTNRVLTLSNSPKVHN